MPRHYVYRAINATKEEVYHGVSLDPQRRKDGSHCVGGTIALKHWDCGNDSIRWSVISQHNLQRKASEKAHFLERNYKHRLKYINITTAGI